MSYSDRCSNVIRLSKDPLIHCYFKLNLTLSCSSTYPLNKINLVTHSHKIIESIFEKPKNEFEYCIKRIEQKENEEINGIKMQIISMQII